MPNPSPSRKDLFLQNALAESASLLFRVGETLGEASNLEQQCLLKIEIASWFLTTRDSLSAVLSEPPERRELSRSAKLAGEPGRELNWTAPTQMGNTSSPDGPAKTTAPISKPGGLSGNSSSGGIGDFPPPWEQLLLFSPPNFSNEKPSVKLPSFWA